MSTAMSDDRLLDGRVRLRQPRDGFRAAIDPVLLAAAVPAAAGERILDVGAGTGAAALCLATRVAGAEVVGLEPDADLVALAAANATATGVADRVRFVHGDLADPPPALAAAGFDHVMANPPFAPPGRGRLPADPGRAAAMIEGGAGLDRWLRFCVRMVRRGGSVAVVHRADRLEAVLAGMAGGLGGLVVFPLWPRLGHAAKRIVVLGRKGSAAPTTLAAGLVLHEADGRYTEAAERVLRRAEPLPMSSAPGPS